MGGSCEYLVCFTSLTSSGVKTRRPLVQTAAGIRFRRGLMNIVRMRGDRSLAAVFNIGDEMLAEIAQSCSALTRRWSMVLTISDEDGRTMDIFPA